MISEIQKTGQSLVNKTYFRVKMYIKITKNKTYRVDTGEMVPKISKMNCSGISGKFSLFTSATDYEILNF